MDSLVSNLLLAGTCILIAHTLNFYLPSKERYGYILALVTVLTIVWIVLSRLLLMLFVDHRDYEGFFTQSLPIRLAVGFLIVGSMALLSVLWYTLQDQILP